MTAYMLLAYCSSFKVESTERHSSFTDVVSADARPPQGGVWQATI